ncbi:CST complex subunit CTC1-like [Musa acuminata AAA Group]|uniref:CST complex subunit CTC1-like n=1 Tax=Musa acuminata AAA Group TaxID=214697 RepID=UPI0031E3675B
MEGVRTLSISDLLHFSRPLSGAASLGSAFSPPSAPKRPRPDGPDENPIEPPFVSSVQNPDPGIFSPLGHPVLLIGTIDLFPEDSDRSLGCLNHCLSFSDGSLRICCYVLDFELKIIGRKVQVLAWNFLPFKHASGGVLEVIQWSLAEVETASDCDPSLSIPLGCSLQETDLKARGRAFGILRAVSPIFRVPCVKGNEDSQKNSSGILMDSGNSIGFFAEMLTCGCDRCGGSRFLERGPHPHEDNNSHSFTNSVFIYFIKPTYLWRPVLFRLIGKAIMVSRLKRKLVFVGGKESYLTFVSTALTMVSLSQLPTVSPVKTDEGMYNGVVTGIYMNGMVVELDDKVWLLITDSVVAPQHSLRVGAIVSVMNYHLVHVNYSWLKTFLLGTCLRTYISIKSFSIADIRYHFKYESNSLLEKFIESLLFSAKFWVLLLVSCFEKKFAGIFSHKDILGSEKKGVVQTYAARCLPPSAFQVQLGLFMNFCKHGQCNFRSDLNFSFLKLVIPISNLTRWCEEMWVSMPSERHDDDEIVEMNQYLDHFLPRGTLYEHMIRRIISSDDLGFVLMGVFKISQCSGRLQLTDATGSIDVVVPDLPVDVDFQTIYEVKDYKLVMEGSPHQVDHLQCHFDGSLSCRAIFQHFSHKEKSQLAVYVHFYVRDITWTSFPHQIPSYMDKNHVNCSNDDMFHLFLVTHKFPVHQSLQDDLSFSNSSGLFAEALILPYNLIPIETYEHGELTEVFLNNQNKLSDCTGQLKDSIEGWSKQSKLIQASNIVQHSDSVNVSREFERSCHLCCSLTFRSNNCKWSQLPVYLYNANGIIMKDIFHNQSDSRVLLEFGSNNFSKYQMIRVGSYYLLKCSKKNLHCKSKGCEHMIRGKAILISETSLWSLSFLFGEDKHQRKSSGDDCSRASSVKNIEDGPNKFCQHEQMFLQFIDQTRQLSDVYLHISTEAMTQLEELEPSQQGLNNLLPSLDEIKSVSSCIQNMMSEVAMPAGIINQLNNELPQGTQISLNGNVENFFIYDCRPRSCVSSSCVANCNQWSTCKVCIYVTDDYNMVRVRGSLSRYAYPIGLGPGANVTFHRVLLMHTSSRWHELMLTPVSFIVVNSVKELDNQQTDRSPIQESRWNIQCEEILDTISLVSISQMLKCMNSKPIRLRCRVVTIVILVLENQTHGSVELRCGRFFKMRAASIPLAGFLLDDGSSLCCCWADNGRAEALLRLHETTRKSFLTSSKILKTAGNQDFQHAIGYHLHKMLKKHHKIVIRNHGATSDLSCEDLTFSVDSHKVFSNADERLLRSIVLNACHASTLNVAGNSVDSTALFCGNLFCGNKEFLEYHQKLQSMPHLWVGEVGHVDSVKEVRSISNILCTG